jgi:hypothetical protein
MAHLVHASKRRRLNEAASTLSRPFKSPLRRSIQKGEENGDEKAGSPAEDEKAANDQNYKTTHSSDEGTRSSIKNGDESATSSFTKLTGDNNNSRSQTQSPLSLANRNSNRKLQVPLQQRRPQASSSYTASLSSSQSDPQLYSLQKQHSALQSRLSALRSELDTVQQALRIETSNKDKELGALIAKWRAVSQEAADELFASAREKVMRMGGLAAWRGREKQRREMGRWYDADSTAAERRDDIDDSNFDAEAGSRMEMTDDVGSDNYRQSGGEQMKEVEEEEVCYNLSRGSQKNANQNLLS